MPGAHGHGRVLPVTVRDSHPPGGPISGTPPLPPPRAAACDPPFLCAAAAQRRCWACPADVGACCAACTGPCSDCLQGDGKRAGVASSAARPLPGGAGWRRTGVFAVAAAAAPASLAPVAAAAAVAAAAGAAACIGGLRRAASPPPPPPARLPAGAPPATTPWAVLPHFVWATTQRATAARLPPPGSLAGPSRGPPWPIGSYKGRLSGS